MDEQKYKKKKIQRSGKSPLRQPSFIFSVFFEKDTVDDIVICNGVEHDGKRAFLWIAGVLIKYFSGLYLVPAYLAVKLVIPFFLLSGLLRPAFTIMDIVAGNIADSIYSFVAAVSFAQDLTIYKKAVQIYTVFPIYLSVIFYSANPLLSFAVKKARKVIALISSKHFHSDEDEGSSYDFSSAQRILRMIGWEPRFKSMARGILRTAILYLLLVTPVFLAGCIKGGSGGLLEIFLAVIISAAGLCCAMMTVVFFALFDFAANLLMWIAASKQGLPHSRPAPETMNRT